MKSREKMAGKVAVLTVSGKMMGPEAQKLHKHVQGLVAEGITSVVVDLSGVEYIDSSGIATLVEGLQWSHSSNNKFRLAGLTPTVRDVFEIARLLTVFEVFDSREEAVQGV